MSAHRVAALCLDGLVAFDLTAATQVFLAASTADGTPLYAVTSCSPGGEEIATTTGFGLRPPHGLDALESADTIVVPGYFALLDPPPEAAIEGLRHAAGNGARILSVCTGAFALGYAGLLDGRRATTHWAHTEQLAKLFPRVEVDAAALYVDEGEVMTSAGLSAGIDLSLHVVREDFGAAAGERVARRMVAAPHREGGQAQFIKRPPLGESGSLEETRRWMAERLAEPLDVAAMARHAAVSPRTFARRFREETGATPLRWLLAQRVLEARRLLEASDLSVEDIAWHAGFGTAASLREHFRRATATTPTAYRRAFRPVQALSGPGNTA
ncbi:MAG TPA: helix-turn-helix domain-containing protein [Solirubrobacterales bacterium]|nr:helix-turn-helix domain-containing protein [Solirubrobacterales bacterium]